MPVVREFLGMYQKIKISRYDGFSGPLILSPSKISIRVSMKRYSSRVNFQAGDRLGTSLGTEGQTYSSSPP